MTGTALLSNYQINSAFNGTLGTNLTNIFEMTGGPQPSSSSGNWVFQQIMVQGGTFANISLPKTQVVDAENTYKSVDFYGEVIFPSEQASSEKISQQEIGFVSRPFGIAPRLVVLPEKEGSKLVEQSNRIFIINTDINNADLTKCNDADLNKSKPNEVPTHQEIKNKKECI